jgi:hypothetical protein
MKKTLLILLAITLVGSLGFAELVVGGDATVSGSVGVTFGYDLDSGGVGFVNDSDIQIVLPILDGDGGAAGDDGIYGEITVEDIGWEWNLDEVTDGPYDSDEDGSTLHAKISATVYFYGLYLGLGAPGYEINKVDVSSDYLVDAKADDSFATGGISLGFMNDLVDVALLISSENDYDSTGLDDIDTVDDHVLFNNDNDEGTADLDVANLSGNFVFGAKLTVDPIDGVTIPLLFLWDPASVGAGFKDDPDQEVVGFGGAPSVELGGLTLEVPFDYLTTLDKVGFEIEPSVAYALMEGLEVEATFLYGSYTNVDAADIDDTDLSSEGKAGADVVNALTELSVSVTDTEAFVPGLEWMLEVTMPDITDYLNAKTVDYTDLTVDVEASYDAGGLKPYMSAAYSVAAAEFDLGLGVELDSVFTGIDNTVITLDYVNDALVNSIGDKPDDTDATESGRVTLDVTVSF